MNKKDLVDAIAAGTGQKKQDINAFFDELEIVSARELANGGEVTLPGIGKIYPVTRSARTGRNPRTGEPVDVPALISVKFKACKSLKTELNGAVSI